MGHFWGVAEGSSVSWVAKLKGDKNSEWKLSNGWSRSQREIELLLPAGNEWSRSYLGVFRRPLTLILLQKGRDTNGRRIVIQIGVYLYYFLPGGGHTFARVSR